MKKKKESLQIAKKEYVKPQIEIFNIYMEESIATTSTATVSIGGPNGSSQPDIFDQPFEEKNYDLEF